MIAANQLRIGNWVKYHDDDTLFKVVEIDTLGMRVENDEQNTWIEYDCFSPIPLTPEILEKCGFAYWELDIDCTDPSDAYWVHRKFKFGIDNLSWTVQKIGVRVKYLHQLQNLYFALTGEELNYKQNNAVSL